ncbi:MAG TPA: malectin domain-containing carbohydrate-binding protein, partial [Cytophagales bacterium]
LEILPITPVNLPPVLAAIGDKRVTLGQTLSFKATATDAEGNALSFSLVDAPAGATIGSATGVFTWTPTASGTFSCTVRVTDNAYGQNTDEERITLTVTPSLPGAYRVNAGGNGFSTLDTRSFTADAYFSGGSVSAPTAAAIAGTADDYLYQTGRHGASFSYNFPTGNGAYDVVLHFAETYFGNTVPGGIGSRKFHVNLEGVRKLTDYDIFARAGGALRVAQETFRVTVSDGTLNVAFLKGAADNPALKAIEVLPAGSALTVNAGGSAYATAGGTRFSPDVYYASGTVSSLAGGEIANTADDALYRDARVGVFSYGLPSGNGTFNVTLHFAETYWGSRAAGGVGSRKFNVYVENVKRLSDYDVFAKAGGAMRAVKETMQVQVTDGVLNLYFARGTADNPLVSAIEVTPAPAAAREGVVEAGAEAVQVKLFPNPVRDRLLVALPFPAAQVRGTAVTDNAGRVHLRDAHRARGENGLEIPAAGLRPGFYLLRLDGPQGTQVVKFLKR